jgi:hypothetical protein
MPWGADFKLDLKDKQEGTGFLVPTSCAMWGTKLHRDNNLLVTSGALALVRDRVGHAGSDGKDGGCCR